MKDDGDTKDDVKVPDNDVGERINRMFKEEEKVTSKFYISQLDEMLQIS